MLIFPGFKNEQDGSFFCKCFVSHVEPIEEMCGGVYIRSCGSGGGIFWRKQIWGTVQDHDWPGPSFQKAPTQSVHGKTVNIY